MDFVLGFLFLDFWLAGQGVKQFTDYSILPARKRGDAQQRKFFAAKPARRFSGLATHYSNNLVLTFRD